MLKDSSISLVHDLLGFEYVAPMSLREHRNLLVLFSCKESKTLPIRLEPVSRDRDIGCAVPDYYELC